MEHELIAWLQSEIATSDSVPRPPSDGLVWDVCRDLENIMDDAWPAVAVRGWKGDWRDAARHVFLSHVTKRTITHTPQVSGPHLSMVFRWLRGLQPTWTSENPSALDQVINKMNRKDDVIALVTETLWREVWARAEHYYLGREQTRSRRAPCPLEKEVA